MSGKGNGKEATTLRKLTRLWGKRGKRGNMNRSIEEQCISGSEGKGNSRAGKSTT